MRSERWGALVLGVNPTSMERLLRPSKGRGWGRSIAPAACLPNPPPPSSSPLCFGSHDRPGRGSRSMSLVAR